MGRTSGEKGRAPGSAPRHTGGRPAARESIHIAGAPGRLAVVIAVVFVGWMALSWIGGQLGLPVALALALDLAALVALGWTLYTLVGIWRTRQREGH